MSTHAIYEVATGRIRARYTGPRFVPGFTRDPADLTDLVALQLRPGEAAVECDPGIDDTAHYVAGGAVVPRPPMPCTLDGYRLIGVPVGGSVTIEGAVYPVTEPTVELVFGLPGRYTVLVEAFPHLPAVYEVSV